MTGRGDEDPDKWFSYLLVPSRLSTDINDGVPFSSLRPLLHDFLSNLLNNQTAGFFTDNPQELWFAKSEERKCLVLRNLCLRLAAYNGWCLTDLEEYLPSPLLLFLLTSLVQIQPGQEENNLANTNRHVEIDIGSLCSPGPALHALTLLHRWVIRTFMTIRTPIRTERTSNMMVPGVKRDPAIIYRDQTQTLVSAVAPTSIKFLESVLETEVTPISFPSQKSFPPGAVSGWDVTTLQPCDRGLFLGLAAYDLGRCYLFCEDYVKSRLCFIKYFEFTKDKLKPESQIILDSEINKNLLAGYLMCLGLEMPSQHRVEQTNIIGKIIDSGNNQYCGIVDVLEKDEQSSNTVMAARENLEDELIEAVANDSRQKPLLANVQLHNIIKRTLLGQPLSIKHKNILTHFHDKSVIEAAIAKKFKASNDSEKQLLKCLVIELVMAKILSAKSSLLSICGIGEIKTLQSNKSTENVSKTAPTFQVETFGSEKIVKLNNCLKLLASFTPSDVSDLISTLGGKNVKKICSRWVVDSDQVNRQKGGADHLHIFLAKFYQLMKMKRYDEAGILLNRAGNYGRLDAEGCLLVLETNTDTAVNVVDNLPDLFHNGLTLKTLTELINIGEWEQVISHTNQSQPYITSIPSSQSILILMMRNLALLLQNIRANNPVLVKNHGRAVWDLVCGVATSGPAPGHKRQSKDNSVDNSGSRSTLVSWMSTVTHDHCARILSSLLASLFNVVRDNPNTDILSPDGALWPSHVSQSYQERVVEDMLTQVLSSALGHHPHDPSLVRMMADLQFANNNYASALALYVETAAIKSDFYHHELGPGGGTTGLDDGVVLRMVTCARELGRLTQAVVLAQFTQEPNYAQAFKFLEDRTMDGSDCLYGCIWDMAILEFAMSLHTKRGEAARRREALQCIWQLELNTNNEEEIIKEAANVRKSMFFRSLALQTF